jgi:dihydrofolate reductase
VAERRLILAMSASLDGFLARRDGVIDWLGGSDDASADAGAARHAANLELLRGVGLIVLGRGGYEEMGPAWASSDSPMARLMNALPKLVFSGKPLRGEWSNTSHSPRAVEEEIPELKRTPGEDVVCFGGARLAHSLARHRLIDEYRLTIHPVALGEGLPLWHGLPDPQRFTFISTTTYADGAVTHVLRP